jgi:hypothetical protein
MVLQDFSDQSINIVSGSPCVVGVICNIETTKIKHIPNKQFSFLFHTIQDHVFFWQYPLFVTHVRSHTSLPGALTYGNTMADLLVSSWFQQTASSHDLLHQSLKSLVIQFLVLGKRLDSLSNPALLVSCYLLLLLQQ